MRINHNISALNTYRQLTANTLSGSKSIEKLSSGLRINRAGDDAAGLAISEKMRGQIRGLDQATRNAQDSISLIQTAEGALNETHSILQRMRELATQAANDTNTSTDRNEIQKEINQLTSEINRIANTTEFNTKKLLNGSIGQDVGAVKGIYEITLDTTFTGSETISIDGQTFTWTSGTANPSASTGATFNNINDLVIALNNNTTISEKYDISITSDTTTSNIGSGKIRLVQKFGKETSTAPTLGGTSTNTLATIRAGVDSTTDQSLTLQIGANQNQTMSIDVYNMSAKSLGISASGTSSITGYAGTAGVTNGTDNTAIEKGLDMSTTKAAQAAITIIDNAIKQVSAERSKLGSFQNRLEHTINNLGTSSENLSAAESRIRDVDMAKEMMEFTKNNILTQASQAMLAQANQQPQGVLQLLR